MVRDGYPGSAGELPPEPRDEAPNLKVSIIPAESGLGFSGRQPHHPIARVEVMHAAHHLHSRHR
jgi:hypothetical protein